jgi:ribose 5-phosphate isomerase B
MKIAVGSDHRGFAQKTMILQFFMQEKQHLFIDIGTLTDERTDYPIYAQKAVAMLQAHEVDAAILLCGSGIGMAIAANRNRHIRAGVAWNQEVAYVARAHDNVNVLVIPSDFVADDQVAPIIESWLKAQFLNDRYEQRLDMIDGK